MTKIKIKLYRTLNRTHPNSGGLAFAVMRIG